MDSDNSCSDIGTDDSSNIEKSDPSSSSESVAEFQREDADAELAVQEVRGAEPYRFEAVFQVPVPGSHADDRAVNPFTKRKSIVVNYVRLFIYNSCLFTRGLVKL